MSSYEQGAVMFLFIFFFIAIAIGLALYVFYSYALYRTAQNNNIKNPGLAYVPFVQMYTLGQIVKDDLNFKYLPEILVGGQFFILFCAFLTSGETGGANTLVSLLGFAYSILLCYTYYGLFKMYSPEHATVLTIVAFFFGNLVLAIFMFSKRHDEPLKYFEKEVPVSSKEEDPYKKED